MSQPPGSPPPLPSRKVDAGSAGDHGPAVLAGFLGWTLDAFDFFLVVMALTAIAREFHKTDAEIALSITLTLAFRPVGAFIFGLLADRYGRRLPLMLDLVFYSVVEVLSGLAPRLPPFLVLRALFGIGMGGEWGVGASLAMEKVPARLRGVFSGLLQQGYAAGYLLAAVCYLRGLPALGLAADVLHRRLAGAAGAVRPLPGEGIRSLAADPAPELVRAGPRHRVPLAAVPLH